MGKNYHFRNSELDQSQKCSMPLTLVVLCLFIDITTPQQLFVVLNGSIQQNFLDSEGNILLNSNGPIRGLQIGGGALAYFRKFGNRGRTI